MKDGLLLLVLGFIVVMVAWLVFRSDDVEDAATVYATETEIKVLRLLQEIDGVGDANVIVYEKEDEIESVVVVCEGADNLRVVMNVREAVASALGTEEKAVKIYLKKE
jgi:hypothetical protein